MDQTQLTDGSKMFEINEVKYPIWATPNIFAATLEERFSVEMKAILKIHLIREFSPN